MTIFEPPPPALGGLTVAGRGTFAAEIGGGRLGRGIAGPEGIVGTGEASGTSAL
jgi:hypothetical protein